MLKPNTLVRVYGHPGIVLEDNTRNKDSGQYVLVEYQTPAGRIRGYVLVSHVKERR